MLVDQRSCALSDGRAAAIGGAGGGAGGGAAGGIAGGIAGTEGRRGGGVSIVSKKLAGGGFGAAGSWYAGAVIVGRRTPVPAGTVCFDGGGGAIGALG